MQEHQRDGESTQQSEDGELLLQQTKRCGIVIWELKSPVSVLASFFTKTQPFAALTARTFLRTFFLKVALIK